MALPLPALPPLLVASFLFVKHAWNLVAFARLVRYNYYYY